MNALCCIQLAVALGQLAFFQCRLFCSQAWLGPVLCLFAILLSPLGVEAKEAQRVSCGDYSFILPEGFTMHYKTTKVQPKGKFKDRFSISRDDVPHNSSKLSGSIVCINVLNLPENWSSNDPFRDMPPRAFLEHYSDQSGPVPIEHEEGCVLDGWYRRATIHISVRPLQSGVPFSFHPTNRYILQFRDKTEQSHYFLSVYEKKEDAERVNYFSRLRSLVESVRYEAPAASRGSQPDTSSKQKQAPAKQKQTAAKQKQTAANQNSVR